MIYNSLQGIHNYDWLCHLATLVPPWIMVQKRWQIIVMIFKLTNTFTILNTLSLLYIGYGLPFNHKQANKDKLDKMVKNKMLVKMQERYYSNTSQLGQVLMETMLNEVSEFCKINIQQSWATQTHQQVQSI